MPPRYTYWTIIADGQPTAFRAATEEELLPTLKQLQARHPDAVMRWFARGKLWDSPDAATEALRQERRGERGERRGPGWRPGGEHEDPRAKFDIPRDVRRKRFADRLRRERQGPPSDADQQAAPDEGTPRQDEQRPPSRPRADRPPARLVFAGYRSYRPS